MFGGFVHSRGGLGRGAVTGSFRRTFSPGTYGEALMRLDEETTVTLQAARRFTPQNQGLISLTTTDGGNPSLDLTVSHAFSERTVGQLGWNFGPPGVSMNLTRVQSKRCRLQCRLNLDEDGLTAEASSKYVREDGGRGRGVERCSRR